jgi:hypothetical protein
MAEFIDKPLSHPEWDPSKGDFYSPTVHADDQYHEKSLKRKKILIGSLVSLHMLLLLSVFIFFS